MKNTVIQFHPITDKANLRFVHGQNMNTHTFPRHTHQSFSLGLIGKGQRTIQIGKQEWHIAAGEGFIINPWQPHTCHTFGSEGHNYWVISINQAWMQRLFTESTSKIGFPYFSQIRITDSTFLASLAAWLQNRPASNKQTLIDLLQTNLMHDAQEITLSRPSSSDSLATAFQQLEARQDETISLHELATATHLSPFYLNRAFRKAEGIPPHAYHLQMRIKKSLQILLETDSIVTTAQQLGFADQSHFTRLFKRQVGITPGRFLDIHTPQ